MTDFLVLAVVARTRLHTRNFYPQFGDQLKWSERCILFPDYLSKHQVEKIAVRATLMAYPMSFRLGQEEFDPRWGEWVKVDHPGVLNDLPQYKSDAEKQFERFLLTPLSEYIIVKNPTLPDVRSYCIRHPTKGCLFRGSLDGEDNYLGVHPGIPYWVNLPRDGVVVVRSPNPEKLKRSQAWFRMGINWLGKVIYE